MASPRATTSGTPRCSSLRPSHRRHRLMAFARCRLRTSTRARRTSPGDCPSSSTAIAIRAGSPGRGRAAVLVDPRARAVGALMVRSVVVCEAQVPFVRGGAERHVTGLVGELRRHGYRVEKVSIPFKPYPKPELLASAAAWRLLDLTEANYERIDLVIATKFPTYFVRHPNKGTWLFHQYRAIYDLCGTVYSEFDHTEADVRLRDTLIRLDREMLGESARLFSNARNTAARLARYNGLTAEPLYHPPPLAGQLKAGPLGDYVLSVGRLETVKRVDLIVGALAHV